MCCPFSVKKRKAHQILRMKLRNRRFYRKGLRVKTDELTSFAVKLTVGNKQSLLPMPDLRQFSLIFIFLL